jgi:hypothetical protein
LICPLALEIAEAVAHYLLTNARTHSTDAGVAVTGAWQSLDKADEKLMHTYVWPTLHTSTCKMNAMFHTTKAPGISEAVHDQAPNPIQQIVDQVVRAQILAALAPDPGFGGAVPSFRDGRRVLVAMVTIHAKAQHPHTVLPRLTGHLCPLRFRPVKRGSRINEFPFLSVFSVCWF